MLTPEAELSVVEGRQHGTPQSGRCGGTLWRGSSDSTMTRMRRATGEALLVPPRNRRSIERPYNRKTGNRWKGERVTDGSAVAKKRSNLRGAKGPCCLYRFQQQGRQG